MKSKDYIPPYILAAQTAFLISTFWVLDYLKSYGWGYYYFKEQIYKLITSSVALADSDIGVIALFIIISRYLISFGILWPILTWVFSLVYREFSKKNKNKKYQKTSSVDGDYLQNN
ncbi:MAG: hypothetical protein WCY93_06075 [Anaerolineaceae bacterium]